MKRIFRPFFFFNSAPKVIGITFCLTMCILNCAFPQNPLLKMWDYRFGGSGIDELSCFQQTYDGGFIVAGYSQSGISGDKSQSVWGGYDYWIVKLDSSGNKQWDKDFGGTAIDYLLSLQQTADGGYILGGFSTSGISGDKSQVTWNNSVDFWIIKTDSNGNKLWDKDFGGNGGEQLYSVQQTADGGYIVGGMSNSGISGDKSQAGWGDYDYWILKIDSLGNKQWDKDFGGTDNDGLLVLKQTADDGYILGGYSSSGISGDKTQPIWGPSGDSDYWIVKTDSLGNKEWDKDLGGTEYELLWSIEQVNDKGYILGGYSYSGISGDKTQTTRGDYDYWLVKTDSLGNKEWDKDFGGIGREELGKVSQTQDRGYLITGDSYSPIGGDKTENNMGLEQVWIIKTDSSGNKLWDKTIFTPGHDEEGLAIQTRDGCYIMANFTNSGMGGYKTQGSRGNSDYWLVKFCETVLSNFTANPYLCPGTCTDFTNISFNATSYQWSFPGASPDTSTDINPQNICYANPGSYDVQLIATNANGNDTLLLTNYITVYPTPPPQSISQSGDTLFAIAGSAYYQWYFNGNIINGATDYFYVAPASGDYNVVATDANGCEVEAAIFNVLASAQLAIVNMQLAIFPNPVGDKFTMHNARCTIGAVVEISVYNMVGEKVMTDLQEQGAKNQDVEIDVSRLVSGMYWIEIASGEKIFRSKFIKK